MKLESTDALDKALLTIYHVTKQAPLPTKDRNPSMRKIILCLIISTLLTGSAFARNDRINLDIKEAYKSLSIESQLSGVQMFFGDQTYPGTDKEMSIIRTNRKTNAFNKSDRQACEWTFLSALLALKDSALSQGGNAVINIKSNYNNVEYSNPSEFQCGVGRIIAGVALIGQVVRLSADGQAKTPSKVNQKSGKCTSKQIQDMKNIGLTKTQIASACE